jgi:hypothetical protein
MARRLTLVAGSGALAPLAAAAARRHGDTLQVIDLVGRGDLVGDRVEHLTLSQSPALLEAVKSFRTSHVLLAGAVHLTDADRESLVRAFGLAGKMAGSLGDVGLAGMILLFGRLNRIKIIGIHEVMPDLLAPEGHIAGPTPTAAQSAAAKPALQAARTIGSIDLGQSVVLAGSRPVAAEDAEGTDALLRRTAVLRQQGLAGNSGQPLVLAKARKPKQPSFVDLPAIGPHTVANAAAAGISLIVVEARASLLLERSAIEAEAAARGVTIIGATHG